MIFDDTVVVFGESVKALDDSGKFGGYLVLFGSSQQTDLSRARDFFTAETDFGLDVATKSRVLYQHGLDPVIGQRKLAVGSLKADDSGIWLEGQLALREAYEQKIWELIKAKKLGLSSGTSPHVIRREKQPNGSHKVLDWPLGLDASLTPNPAEPRTMVTSLKSLALDHLKGDHLGPDVEAYALANAFRSVHEQHGWAVGDAMRDPKASKSQKLAKVKGIYDEAHKTTSKLLGAMLPEPAGATKGLYACELEAQLRLLEALLED